MALEYNICFSSNLKDCTQSTFEDRTIYGESGNAQRHEVANKYLAFKVDVDGQPTSLIISEGPDPVNLTGQTNSNNYVPDKIVIPNTLDGWFRLNLLTIDIWSADDSYTKETSTNSNDESIIYYSNTQLFYKAIEDNNDIAPDGPGGISSWKEITNFEILIQNTSLVNFEFNTILACRLENAYSKQLANDAKNVLCNECKTFKEIERSDNLNMWLNSSYSSGFNELYSEGEKISRHIQDKL